MPRRPVVELAPSPSKTRPDLVPRRRLSRRQWRLLGAGVVLLVALALRVPWRNADVGNAGLWTYGYFVTDEGYFTSGGRIHALTGHCLDPEMNDPPTFGAAPAMHYLSALSYRIRGVTYDACRWPTMLAGAVGWVCAFWLASSVTHPAIALLVTLVLSVNPLSLTYERASSSDVVVGGFLLLALCLARARKAWAWFPAGALLALAPAVKATGIGFLPLAFLLAATLPRRRWFRIGAIAAGFAAGWVAMHGFNAWVLRSHPSHLAPAGLRGACSMSAGGLPRPTWEQAIRALSVFPRYPVDTRLGVFIAWCLGLPAWAAIAQAARGWRHGWNRRLALYVGVLVFGLALAVQVAPVERYFLALVMLTPFLLVNARASLFGCNRGTPALRGVVLAGAAVVALAFFWTAAATTQGRAPDAFLANEYNLPASCSWLLTWPGLALTGAVLMAALSPWRGGWRGIAIAALAAPIGAQLFYHAWAMARLGGPYSAPGHTTFLVQQILLLATLGLFVVPGRHCRWPFWYGTLAALFLLVAVGDHHWRMAYPALLRRTENVYHAAQALERALPANSIVLGNRASSLLRGSRLRLGCCSPNFSAQSFVDKVQRIIGDHPGQPVFLLVDEDHSYHWTYIQQKGLDVIDTQVVGSLSLPAAGGEGRALRVYVVRLTARKTG